MAYAFKAIIIIYNPVSTGSSKADAHELRRQLKARLPQTVKIVLRATDHAGHATEIAAQYAKKDEPVLLVSASGDGGYNELINGIAPYPAKRVACCVLPSGNANDHHHATSSEKLVERIENGETRKIDVLKVEATVNGQSWHRYAHSYVGIGLTAFIGKRLTAAELNPVKEKWLVLRYLLAFRHVTIKVEGQKSWRRYSSIVASNIDRMSKIIKLAPAHLEDGKFEVYETRYRSIMRIIGVLIVGSTVGLRSTARTNYFFFNTRKALEVQCDGEVTKVDGNSKVVITSQSRYLRVIR